MIDYFSDNSIDNGIEKMKNAIIKKVKENIKNLKYVPDIDFIELLKKIFKITSKQIVFIIDEWDVVIREKKEFWINRKIFKFLNKILKDKKYIALVYMTGILPLKKTV